MSQDQGQLRKSHKMDFSNHQLPLMVSRERSFVRPNNKDGMKRRSQTMMAMRGKPSLEIYRPPNVRTDLPMGGKLNVHAKEFTMTHDELQQTSNHSGHLMNIYEPVSLQHSKSSGNMLRHLGNHPGGLIPLIPGMHHLPLLHSASSSHLLNHHQVVGPSYHRFPQELLTHPVFTGMNQQPAYWANTNRQPIIGPKPASLKRSKSLGAAESRNLATALRDLAKEEFELGMFAPEDQANVKLALEDPNQLPSRTLMDLVKTILEKVVEGIKYSESIAKLCVSIIDTEKNQTFLESLLNTCQQWYQERDKILRGVKAGDGTRFTAFMWFLAEMCGQLKRHQLREQFAALQPELVLLSVLAKCCQACVSLPIKCLAETECLFFVLTSIGRDLEAELPQQLEQLLASVRDGFLASAGSPSVRRTLLQLIELHASNWQLPGSSVLYYYPRIK